MEALEALSFCNDITDSSHYPYPNTGFYHRFGARNNLWLRFKARRYSRSIQDFCFWMGCNNYRSDSQLDRGNLVFKETR